LTIKDEILNLEMDLTRNEVRSSAKRISEILDEGFIEYCCSGKVYSYKKDDVFPIEKSIIEIQLDNFVINELSEKTFHATYTAIKIFEDKKEKSLRSSIWKVKGKKLKLIFHQGTKMAHTESKVENDETSKEGDLYENL